MPRKAKQLVEPIDTTLGYPYGNGIFRPKNRPRAAIVTASRTKTKCETQDGWARFSFHVAI